MRMRKKDHESSARPRLLILVDESNVGSSVRTAGRGLDWLKLRDFLAGPDTGRELIEMVVYAGLPPAIPIWQEERDKKNKFMHWLRSNGFMVVTKKPLECNQCMNLFFLSRSSCQTGMAGGNPA